MGNIIFVMYPPYFNLISSFGLILKLQICDSLDLKYTKITLNISINQGDFFMRDGEMLLFTVLQRHFSCRDLKFIFLMILDIVILRIFVVHKMRTVISVDVVPVNEKIILVFLPVGYINYRL